MASPRFFCPLPLQEQHTIALPADLAHYALRVLRLKDGAQIQLFNGEAGQFDAVLQVDGKAAHALIGKYHAVEAELPGQITLVQGLPAGDKMDWVVEKAVELGAYRLVPITAQRSITQLGPQRQAKRMRHWERIAQSASEQCGRNRIMHIDTPITLQAWMTSQAQSKAVHLLCHPQAEQALHEALTPACLQINLLVGPEGGWSITEQQQALALGARPVRFGPRVLRTETAGLALLAAVSALQGWL